MDTLKDLIDRLTFCCARASDNLKLKPEVHQWLEDSIFDEKCEDIMSWFKAEYYALNWPIDYAHLYDIDTVVKLNIDEDSYYEGFDLLEENVSESDCIVIHKTLNDYFHGDLPYDNISKVRWDTERYEYSELFFALCQEERKKIIERHLRNIVSKFKFRGDESYLDLMISVPKEVEKYISHYIELVVRLFAKKNPNVRVRTAFSQHYSDTIAESCTVLWIYASFTIKSESDTPCLVDNKKSDELYSESPLDIVENHGDSYDEIEDYSDEFSLKEALHKFDNAKLYTNWLTSKEVLEDGYGIDMADIYADAHVYCSDDALSDAVSNLIEDYECEIATCAIISIVIFIGTNFQNKKFLFQNAKTIILKEFRERFPEETINIKIGIAHDPYMKGECELSLYGFCC